jgi:serine protease Do
MRMKRTLLFALLALAALRAHALTPEELFTRIAPSIWFVYGVDPSDRRLSQGSGVVIGPQRVITNCHVVQGASTVFLRKENVLYVAKVEHRDTQRDLCQLQVANLSAPPVELGSSKDLKVGQKVFALGNPKGLEVTLSDGLVSALRGPDGKDPIIQTTAPISQGSSGGGLFSDKGKLVGITTAQDRSGQNLNFAMPADWISEIPARMKVADEKKTEQVAALRASGVAYSPASPALPPVGATWKYRYNDLKFSRGGTQVFSLRVESVDGWLVNETFTPEGATSTQIQKAAIGAEELRFTTRALFADRMLIEFAPYLAASEEKLNAPMQLSMPSGYPIDAANSNEWKVSARVSRGVPVKVPAGDFQAVKVELVGTRPANQALSRANYETGRFQIFAWYAPETRRIVRLEHRSWYANSMLATDEAVELLEFSGI